MPTERQATQVRQPFELIEGRAADVAMGPIPWVPVGHTHEDVDGVFVGVMAHSRELALEQQLERGAPEHPFSFAPEPAFPVEARSVARTGITALASL